MWVSCNDGVMLKTVAEAGVRHLGVEPCGGVAEIARANGVRVATEFFQESLASSIRAAGGPADVIFGANTISHIPYMDSILRGVDALLGPNGVFVFEDPYLVEIVRRCAFDQIYDEHFYFFSARSVQAMARQHGLDLVEVEALPVHGGEIRYTPTPAVAAKPAVRGFAHSGPVKFSFCCCRIVPPADRLSHDGREERRSRDEDRE